MYIAGRIFSSFPRNDDDWNRRLRALDHVFGMEGRNQQLVRQARHHADDIRHLSREPIEARGRRRQEVGQHHVTLLAAFGPAVEERHGVLDVHCVQHGEVVEHVLVRGVDVTCVGFSEG